MAITVTAVGGAGTHGPAMPGPLATAAPQQVSNAIGQVTAGNMFGALGTFIADVHGWRVDRQNAAGGMVNVSVQRNNIGPPSTVATVFVPTTFNTPPPAATNPAAVAVYQAQRRELERCVRRGLEQSFASHAAAPTPPNTWRITRFELAGTFAA